MFTKSRTNTLFLGKFQRSLHCFLKNLHGWQEFYTTAGRTGRAKYQLCAQKAQNLIETMYWCSFLKPSPWFSGRGSVNQWLFNYPTFFDHTRSSSVLLLTMWQFFFCSVHTRRSHHLGSCKMWRERQGTCWVTRATSSSWTSSSSLASSTRYITWRWY